MRPRLSRRHLIAPAIAAVTVLLGGLAPGPRAAAPTSVVRGTTPDTAVFPSDAFTVADPAQVTGRRVALPVPSCNSTNYSICDDVALLNTLDGFDLQPRVAIPFTGPVDVASVTPSTVFLQAPDGSRTGISQLVFDPATNILAGITVDQLQEATTYTIVVTAGVKDRSGAAIDACGGTCVTPFTTRTATAELGRIRQALDDGSAYTQAGIADRSGSFVQNSVADVFPAATVLTMNRLDQTTTDCTRLSSSLIPDLAVANRAGSTYAFGSVEVPRYMVSLDDAAAHQPWEPGVIPPVPSTQTPPALGKQRIGFVLVVPAGSPPPGGWPVAIYGPGFTRSKYDLFVTADANAAAGVATLATDPQGHAYGPCSAVQVTTPTGSTTVLGYGQGRDLDGDAIIADGLKDGVGPTDHKVLDKNGKIIDDLPSRQATDGLRSGLIQTTVNNMALVRMIEHGVNIPTLGDVLRHSGVEYYGLSFGGIYGTMLMATDTHLQVGFLNALGGPIADIARLSSFRGDIASTLKVARPNLLNGGPGLDGFTESLPLRNDAPVTRPWPGSILIQHTLEHSNWYDRAGSPEAFAPLLRLRPPAGAPVKTVLFQSAWGDQTVPNPTNASIYRAGHLFDRVVFYRNDHTPTYASDPHGWLADPTLFGRQFGEAQLTAYLQSGGATVLPLPAPFFEVPIADPHNLECLHYPDPQTGQSPNPTPFQPDCPAPGLTHAVIDYTGTTAASGGSAASGSSAGSSAGASVASIPNTAAAAGPSPWPALALLLLGGGAARRHRRRRADG